MRWLWVTLASLAYLLTSQVEAQNLSKPPLPKDAYLQILESVTDDAAFENFLSRLGTLTVGDETKRTYYVLEGDLLLTKEQARAAIIFQSMAPQPATVPSGELLLMTEKGKRVFWDKDHRSLTYAVKRSSFLSSDAYNLAVKNMAIASNDWISKCGECGLSFMHRSEFDANPTTQNVTFIVEYNSSATDFIAASFFPNDPIFRRQLIIGPSYFTTSFDRVGVLRHELGHVLGYRHEQIRGISGCYKEDANWTPLTDYDSKSVMYYYCGGGGTLALILSPSDIAGHRDLYR